MRLETDVLTPSPRLKKVQRIDSRRQIDDGLLHYEASISGFSERYGRGETSHTVHVWWARRPHSAMRALVFASLCKQSNAKTNALLSRLGASATTNSADLKEAATLLKQQYLGKPRVLDMFGGGGTIPLEAAFLGAESHAIDANHLSVFIQKCHLEYSQQIGLEAALNLVKASGQRVLHSLAQETQKFYSRRNGEISKNFAYGYLWTYSFKCKSCGMKYLLSKRPWVSKKKGKNLGFFKELNCKKEVFRIAQLSDEYNMQTPWKGKGKTTTCPSCKKESDPISIKDCTDQLVAAILPRKPTGKDFVICNKDDNPDFEAIAKKELEILQELSEELPKSLLPRWSGIVNPALYGIETHSDFLNPRQRLVLLMLIKELRKEHGKLLKEQGEIAAKYVIGQLSALIDQLVDWNCRLSMWISQNEQVGRAFSGPGVPMLWDYVEIDPLANGPANLWSKLERIIEGTQSITSFSGTAKIQQGFAQNLPYDSASFDAIVTDPPYYDNIFYSILADFFYSWKRLLLSAVEPGLFENTSTDSGRELVASKFRSGTAHDAHEKYCTDLTAALSEASRVLKPDGVLSFVYSHSSLLGWEALARSFRNSHLTITSVQPLSIERKARPRAMTSEAINTCIAFVARKRNDLAKSRDLVSIECEFLEYVMGKFATSLEATGWSPEDIGIALYSHGVSLIANYRIVDSVSDETALLSLEAIVKRRIPSFAVQKRGSI